MIDTISKQAAVVRGKYPFLDNFPFSEFQIEAGEAHNSSAEANFGQKRVVDPNLLKFTYTKGQSNISIVIFEQELNWLNQISNKITDLDKAKLIIDSAIESNDLLVKRDGVNFAEEWASLLKDKNRKLSYSTSGEILLSLIKSQEQLITIINKIMQLSVNRGLVGLTVEEYQIILTYYQFQLIYVKLILGIIISAKISL